MAADPVSQSEGRFLGGTVLGSDLATLLSVASAQAASAGVPAEMLNPLTIAALNALDIPLGPVNLLGTNGVLTLGAVAQYARAEADGSSVAATGAVTDSGAIGVGGAGGVPAADASLTLTDLIPGGIAGVLGGLTLDVGALAARATQAAGAGGAQVGSYSIADLGLDLTSPVIAQLFTTLRATLAGLQPTVDGIADTLDALTLGLAVVTGIPQLTTVVDALGSVTSGDGSLHVDLKTGAVELDVAALVDAAGPDLNNLPADTDLLPLIVNTLTTHLLPTITTALTNLTDSLTTALNGIGATVLGVPIAAGDLLSAVTPVLTTVTGVVGTTIATLDPVLDDTLAGALPDVIALVANAQDAAAGRFTETALRVGVLPSAGPAAATLDLASASVGPNGGPVVQALPVATGIDPDHGPEAGGTLVTITGTDFTSDATVRIDGGSAITPSSIDPGGTALTYLAPPHAPGPVGVTVTTADGTTDPLTYTYDPAPAVAPVENPPPAEVDEDEEEPDEPVESSPVPLEPEETALPRTGADVTGVAAFGLASLLGGVGLVAGGRAVRSSGTASGRHRATRGRHARR